MKLPSIFFIALLALIVWKCREESEEWEQFKRAHHCRQVIDATGALHANTGYTEGWLCDDGITYYR